MKAPTVALPLMLLCLAGCRTNETPRQQVNDLEITANIKSKLAADVGLSTVGDVSVNSTDGVVTLAGSVDSADTKAKVDTIARAVPKVVRVVDNVQVAAGQPPAK